MSRTGSRSGEAEATADAAPLREQAIAFGHAGEWGAALSCGQRALRLDAGNALLHHELAGYAAKLGLTDRAIRHFRLAALGGRSSRLLTSGVL